MTKGKKDTAKFTILRRANDARWEPQAMEKLMKLGTGAYMSTKNLACLVITGAHEKEDVARVLGHDGFTCEVVEGKKNPKLPFAVY